MFSLDYSLPLVWHHRVICSGLFNQWNLSFHMIYSLSNPVKKIAIAMHVGHVL